MSDVKKNGIDGRIFHKVDDPMSLFPILESRLPLSCCLVNLLLAYDTFKHRFVAYTFEDTTISTEVNGVDSETVHQIESKAANGNNYATISAKNNLWILFNYNRDDWTACISISSPTPNSPDISPRIKYALEYSEIFDWRKQFLMINLDQNVSDFLIDLNIRKFGNVIKIYPCFLFYLDPDDASKMEVPTPSEPNVKVGPIDPVKGTKFFLDIWESTAERTEEFIKKDAFKHVNAAVYLPNGEIACAAITAAYGNICMLVTHPDHRRKGYASLVMRFIIRELGRQGFHAVWETALRNPAYLFHKTLKPNIIAHTDYICHKCM